MSSMFSSFINNSSSWQQIPANMRPIPETQLLNSRPPQNIQSDNQNSYSDLSQMQSSYLNANQNILNLIPTVQSLYMQVQEQQRPINSILGKVSTLEEEIEMLRTLITNKVGEVNNHIEDGLEQIRGSFGEVQAQHEQVVQALDNARNMPQEISHLPMYIFFAAWVSVFIGLWIYNNRKGEPYPKQVETPSPPPIATPPVKDNNALKNLLADKARQLQKIEDRIAKLEKKLKHRIFFRRKLKRKIKEAKTLRDNLNKEICILQSSLSGL